MSTTARAPSAAPHAAMPSARGARLRHLVLGGAVEQGRCGAPRMFRVGHRERKSAISSSEYSPNPRTWLKIWIACVRVPRSTAFAGPPAGTWHTDQQRAFGSTCSLRMPCSVSLPLRPAPYTARCSSTGCSRAVTGGARAADRGHRRRALHGRRRLRCTPVRFRMGEPVFQSRRAERHRGRRAAAAGGHATGLQARGPEEVKAFREANDNRGFRGSEEGEERSGCA